MHRTFLQALLVLVALAIAACEAGDDLMSPSPGPETVRVNGVELLVGDTHPMGETQQVGETHKVQPLILLGGGDDDDCGGGLLGGLLSGSCDSGSDNRDKEWISRSSGGHLQISGAELRVARYSVSKSSSIVMERAPDTFGVWTIRFEPSGLTFAPPARLTISVKDIDGIDPARIKIAGASSGAEDWQVLGGTYDPAKGTVSIDIYHFSRYALCVE
jgi:hypothetical protein